MMMMVLLPRWLCLQPLLFLLILLAHNASCQLSLGEAGTFLPEDLDAGGANPGDGKVPESSSLTGASGSNAPDVASVHADAANASDPSSAGATAVDIDLTITPTDYFPEDVTNVDFDDYLTDEAEMTTEAANLFEDEINKRTGETEYYNNPTEGEGEPEGATSAVPQLTRRIVFSGPSVSPTAPEPNVEFTRPSSVVRDLGDPNLDIWMPNWPSELLLNSGEPTRRPTIRFPTESPSSIFDATPVPTSVLAPVSTAVPAIAPSYTVTKVPVTQYYFDLTSVAPTPVPGPLFDEEDLTSMTVSAVPSVRPDLSRQIMELSSSISDLQSSALVEAAAPLSITPTLSGSRETTVVTEPSVMVASSALLVTPVPTPALTVASSTSLDEGVESEVVDNNLDEHLDSDDSGTTLVEENPLAHDIETSGPRPPQSHPDPQEGDNTTAGEVLDQAPSSGIAGELPGTSELQSIFSATTTTTTTTTTTSSTAHSTPAAGSELVTATSTSTPTSIKPTFTRSSQATDSSRTPLWMLLSQSVPSRPVTSQPPSTQLNSSLTTSTTPTPVLLTPVTPASPPPDDEISSPSPPAGVSPTPALIPSPASTQEVPASVQSPAVPLNDSSPQIPQNNNPPIDAAAANDQPEDGNSDTRTVPSAPSTPPAESINATTTLAPPHTMRSELTPGNEHTNSTVNESPPLSPDFISSRNAVSSLATNTSTVEYTENGQNHTSLPSLSAEATLNKTESENEISEEPVVITLPEDSPSHPDQPPHQGETTSVVDPTEVGRETHRLDSSPWTPISKQTDNDVQNIPITVSPSVITTTTLLVTTTPPELTSGFTPIVGGPENTNYVPHSEVEVETSQVPSPTPTTAIAGSTAMTTAPLDGSSTRPAHSPNLIDSSAPTSVHMTSLESESVMPNDQSSPDRHLTSNILTRNDLMPSVAPLPTAVQASMKDEPTPISKTPTLSEFLPTISSSDTVPSEAGSSMLDNFPEPTTMVTAKSPSTSTAFVVEVFPSPSDTTTSDTINKDRYPSSEYSPSVIQQSSATPLSPDIPVSSASVALLPTPHAEPNTDSPTLVVAPTATEDSTVVTPTHSVQLEEPEEGVEEDTYEELPENEPDTVDDISLGIPPATISPPATSPPQVTSSLLPVTTPPPPLVSSSHAPPPITSPPPDPVNSSPPPPSVSNQPTPSVRGPPVTSQAPPQSVTTPRATTTTTETSTTVTSPPTTATSPVPTTPLTDPPTSSGPTEFVPTLTTTMMLPNGTMVMAPLPHIRALVTYTTMEFCRHKGNFRTMFSEWITKHLAGEAMVKPKDIKFFNMATCPSSQSTQDDHMEDDSTSRREDEAPDTLNMLPDKDQDETNVYFYVTRSGVMDPDLTEQFPRFPMDLEISEDLTYLRPKVTQLELVRGHGATNTDLLLEEVAAVGTSVIVIIVICSIVGVTIIVALLLFMVVKRRGSTNNYYGRRCTPVSMDAYSMDSVSVYHSFRRKSKRRASGRSIKSYLNQAFDDPNGPSRPLNFAKLTHFISDIDGVHEEFGTIPVNMPKYDELPAGVEDKNRYANVIPVPETRVLLKVAKDSRNSDYINANYVRGARNESKYYIATQAPLDDTVADFWRMIWEQETRVVVMLTDFVEKGIDKCADYLPPSETLDCHRVYSEFQVTLKSRDMKEKFVVSNVQLKNLENSLVREVAHMWFTGWPAAGVPNEEAAFISFILEVRRTRKRLRAKGPIVMHCSPGTGRTGTLLACDIVMKQFEDQRCIDVARTVYSIRRDRAGAVQTKEQYAFIYRVINLYASKLTSGNLDSL